MVVKVNMGFKRKLFLISLIVIALFNGCNSSKNEIIFDSLESQLIQFGFINTELKIKETKNEIKIDILFKKNKSNKLESYFLDIESNKMLISVLVYNTFQELKDFKKVYFHLTFENGAKAFLIDKDYLIISLDSQEILNTVNNFNQNPLFYDFVDYSLKNISKVDLTRMEGWILYLLDNFDMFQHDGSFWSLIHNYSLGCNEPKENLKSIFQFMVFVILLNDSDNPKKHGVKLDQLNYFFEKCNYDHNFYLKLTIPQLFDHLDKTYFK